MLPTFLSKSLPESTFLMHYNVFSLKKEINKLEIDLDYDDSASNNIFLPSAYGRAHSVKY